MTAKKVTSPVFAGSVVCFVTLLASISSTKADILYDLANDWSDVANPNGVWSYNQGNSPLTFQQLNWGGVNTNSLSWTTTSSGTQPPAWSKSVEPPGFGFDWQAGDVVVHSTNFTSDPSSLANVTWTSPDDGTISLSGAAWDAYFDFARDASWQLSINGTVYSELGSVFGVRRTDASASFAQDVLSGKSLQNIAVSTGDVVMFQVESASSDGHFTGVNLDVDFSPAASVPLPSVASGGLSLLAGMLGMKLFSRRDRIKIA